MTYMLNAEGSKVNMKDISNRNAKLHFGLFMMLLKTVCGIGDRQGPRVTDMHWESETAQELRCGKPHTLQTDWR